MSASDKTAAILIGIAFLLMSVFVSWPDTWTWYQELIARLLMLVISAGSFTYLFAKRQ